MKIQELSILDELDLNQLLVEWNQTQAPFPSHLTLHELIEEQVKKTPRAIALVFENKQMTYEELNDQANQVAHYLCRLGAGPDCLIAIALERSLEMVIGLLGILKAGAAYIPLDPDYPEKRLEFILDDAKTSILITYTNLEDKFSFYQGHLILLDQKIEALKEESKLNLKTRCSPHHLAYVIYTSGSTGQPKGVCNIHQAIVNRIYWMQEQFRLNSNDRVLQKTSFSFDVSVWELFLPLMAGAELHLISPQAHLNPNTLVSYIQKHKISIIHFVPSMLRLFLQAHGVEECSSLRLTFSSGEALDKEVEQEFFKKLKSGLYNLYGPTEAAIDVTYWKCLPTHDLSFVPIGRPIANTEIYILDEQLKPLAIGVAGELYIGGVGLARGYLNRQDLTSQKFIPHPFNSDPHTRLYKTGDLARYLPDGTIAYLGRLDHQVKIRGYRIELGEIETVLKAYPDVKNAAVIVREDQIFAYLISDQKTQAPLRSYLEKRLPHYMIPNVFTFLEEFPLTPNGKLDRDALPYLTRHINQDNYVAPRTEIERILINIWSELLGKEKIGIYDHFFSLGGHSLLAIQLISKISSQLLVDITLKTLFEIPTVAQLAELIEYQKLPKLPAIKERDYTQPVPLSFAQQRLWVVDQVVSNKAIYNIPIAVRLRGALNVEALERACNDLVARHETLRTTIAVENGQPYQSIALTGGFLLKRMINSDFQKIVREEVSQPFDLTVGPLIRGTLISVEKEDHVLLIIMHHIIADEWSLEIFFRELSCLYQAYRLGTSVSLPLLPIQYADFTVWQREWLKEETLEKQVSYWQQTLQGIPECIQLPTDYPRPLAPSHKGNVHYQVISPELLLSLKKKADNKETSLFVLLLAAFQGLLYRYSYQEDIVVGCPIANRHYPQVEGIIGFFLNTLAIRTNFSGELTFDRVLEHVKTATLNAYEHQDVPFEQLIDVLKIDRQLNRHPVYQVRFFLDSAHSKGLELDDLSITPLALPCEHAKFDLMLSAQEKDNELHLRFEYATDLFAKETVERIAFHFKRLLEIVIQDSSQPIEAISLLDEEERQKILCDWNTLDKDILTRDTTVHALFEKYAEDNPNALALVYKDESLTYRELNQRANQLARYMQSQETWRGSLVVLRLDRSIEMIIALLAVLKAGGAYVPIDPSYPVARINFILGETQAKVLIQKEHFELIQDFSIANLETQNEACDLVYVIYTSGSTGNPKGVMVEHKQLINYINAINERLSLKDYQNFAIASTFATDLSNTLIFGALCNGKTLHIIPEDCLYTAKEMSRYLNEHKIDCVKLVPSHLKVLLDENYPLSNLCLILGGERLDWQLVEKVRKISPKSQIVNHYGPTETTIGAATCKVGEQKRGASVPIGRALPNMHLYILDKSLQPVPIGVIGELYIGGAGVARGYYNQKDLTDKKFIYHSFDSTSKVRIYQTGDLARYLPDGQVEFLGRIDHQVKIRGYRIELEEISSALKQHGDVKDASVIAKDNQLIAYIVPHEFTPTNAELRAFLEERLPSYMLPYAYVVLDSFPLTPNGKLDRHALPAPKQVQEGHVLPRNLIEEQLAGIWSELLNREEIGIYDSFFHSGGHSLLATQLISSVRRVLNVEISLRILFESPTIAGLAAIIENIKDTQFPFSIPKRDSHSLSPLSFAQQRLWFVDKLQKTAAYNIPICFRLKGDLNYSALNMAFNALIQRHESLRTTIQVINGEAYQAIAEVEDFIWDKIDQGDFQKLAQQEAIFPFNLESGPLFRVKLIKVNANEHVLLVTMHHIIADGWSIDIFFRELSLLYNAHSLGHIISLPKLSIQYADFAVWQREWLNTTVLEKQKHYWKENLRGIPDAIQLPYDHPRPLEPSYRGEVFHHKVERNLLAQLKLKAEEKDVSLFMVLLAAFQCLLYRYTHQEDIVVGCPISNRHYPQVEGIIGFFVNTLAIRTNFNGHPTFDTVLERVRVATLSAYDNQDVPFEQIVDTLDIERRLNRHPVYQVRFFLDRDDEHKLELEGLEVNPIPLETHDSKFDLMVSAQEKQGELNLRFEYATDLFERGSISNLAEHFICFLESLATLSSQPIENISLLTIKERHRVLVEWNQTFEEMKIDLAVHTLFESWAERTPHTPAVVYKDETLTYAVLNERANQLAYYLREVGVGKESLVAIKMDRSVEMVIALLGILKAGGAYVPIDPSFPESRICFILEDTKAKVLLTQQDVCCIQGPAILNGEIKVESNDLMYVIYTSGSTGQPKGVMVEHAQLLNYITAIHQRVSLNECRHLALASTLATDLGNTILYGALSFGKTLYIVPNECLYAPRQMTQFLSENAIDCLKLVPSHLKALLDEDYPFPKMHLILGGERLEWEVVDAFRNLSPKSVIINHYGPTETTIGVATYLVDQKKIGASVPIGKPIANTQFYILDEFKQPSGIGIFGELYISGKGVARGYLNRPDLTADKFIKDPFSHDPTERIYKTGDLARYLPDGNVEFLRRVDHQVKLRGYRIELEEITAILKCHGDVQDAVVIAKDHQLIAYIIADEFTPTSAELRAYLETKLPSYMIPAAYIVLDAFPLTANGKLDRNALPIPDQEAKLNEGSYIPPTTPIELNLATIWAELLGQKEVGIYDNFFHSGGDSIICIQFVSRARQKGIILDVKQVFQAPTIAALASVAKIKPLEQENLSFQIDRPNDKELENDLEAIGEVEDIYPLAPMQEGMLFRTLYEPSSDAYLVQILFEIEGNFEPERMKEAWQYAISQISILRTGFCWENLSQPMQYVAPSVEIPWKTYDFRGQEDSVEQLLEVDRKEAFNFLAPPLIRLHLMRIEENRYYLLWTKHHIILDGWSTPLILERVWERYSCLSSNKLSLPYKNYINWLQQQDRAQAELFWHNYLKGFEEATYIGSICDAYNIQGFSLGYEYLYLSLTEDQTLQLKEIAKHHQITLNTIVQGVWSLLLSCYLQKDDLIFGVTVSGRSIGLESIEEMIGLFINTLPLRVQIDPEETFITLLQRLQRDTVHLQEQAFLPLPKIQSCSDLEKGQALFDHIFVFENFPIGEKGKSFSQDIKFSYKQGKERSEYPFTISIVPRQQLEFKLGFDLLYFSRAIVEEIAHRLQILFDHVLLGVHQTIKTIPYLNDQERHIILYDWNRATSPKPTKMTLSALFEDQVEKTPHATAAISDIGYLSYKELNCLANQLAHHLRQLGVQQEDLLIICCHPSFDMLVGLMGILKAGAAYIPVEPNYPQKRLEQIIQDANSKIIVTHSSLLNQFSYFQGQLVCLDQSLETESLNPAPTTHSKNLAYVIYTSGSTGIPKGVMIEHESVINYLLWCQKTYACDQGEGAALLSSFAFDMSITSIFLPLTTGRAVFIIEEYALPPFERLSWIKLTPTHLKSFAQRLQGEEEIQINQKLVFIIGGEKLDAQDLNFWQNRYPQALFFNEYGPTEATVACSAYLLPHRHTSPLIGRPIENSELYILDQHLRPIPIGVIGELYIGGIGLARGYLHRPELTKQKFISNLFKPDTEAKLYQTGDLVRYLPCGNIEFIGRKDQQIKIKGYRVEPEEIESILKQHGDITAAIVIVKQQRLMAYFIAGEFVPTDSELRMFLKSFLPEYMIPAKFIQIADFPMTPNGKLDVLALPDPDKIGSIDKQDFIAPRNETEALLARIWSELLNVDNISIHDNFFHLGGDSIISIQAVSKARLEGLYINVKQVFMTPTIAELANALHTGSENRSTHRDESKGKIQLSPIQKRFFEQPLVNYHHFNQAMFLKPKTYLDFNALKKALQAIVQFHEAFHLRFKQNTDHWEPYYAMSQEPILKLCREAISSDIVEKIQGSLNIEKGPIIQAVLFEDEKEEHKLLIVVHHLIIDGVSWRILLEHLEIAYTQFVNNQPLSLPKKSTLWNEWTSGLKEYAHTLKDESSFWQRQQGEKLSIDFNKGSNTYQTAEELSFSIEREETTLLIQHVPKAFDTQINDILLTALVLAKGDWSGNYTLYVSLEGHGREPINDQIEISQTIGWFTSLFPVLLSLDKVDSLKDNLSYVKRTLRTIPNRGIGYGILKYLSQDEALRNRQEPEISFNYLGQWDNSLNQKALFSFSSDFVGPTTAKENPRPFLISINAQIREGIFKIYFKYSSNHYTSQTITLFGKSYIKRLKELINLCSPIASNLSQTIDYLVPLQSKGFYTPFFCVHPIGGDVFWYWPLAQSLGFDQPFYAFQNLSCLPPPSVNSIQKLCHLYLSQLKKIQPFGPYYLGGWSFGAYVAFEIAIKLQQEGEEVKRLIIFDQPIKKPAKIKSICEENKVKRLRSQFIEDIKLNSLKEENAYKEHSLLAYEYNSRLLKCYHPEGKVNSITLFNSSALCEAGRHIEEAFDPTFGWKQLSKEQEIYTIPGDHFTILEQPYVQLLAAKLKNSLRN